jgi:hypothetical protein
VKAADAFSRWLKRNGYSINEINNVIAESYISKFRRRRCPCGWRIHEITWRQASDTTLDSASASRTKQILSVKAVPQLSVRAAVLPTRHVFNIHYNNVGNQVASLPDRPSSKITFGPGILAGLFHFVAIPVMWRLSRPNSGWNPFAGMNTTKLNEGRKLQKKR